MWYLIVWLMSVKILIFPPLKTIYWDLTHFLVSMKQAGVLNYFQLLCTPAWEGGNCSRENTIQGNTVPWKLIFCLTKKFRFVPVIWSFPKNFGTCRRREHKCREETHTSYRTQPYMVIQHKLDIINSLVYLSIKRVLNTPIYSGEILLSNTSNTDFGFHQF